MHHISALRNFQFSKFPGGACSQTPLAGCGCGVRDNNYAVEDLTLSQQINLRALPAIKKKQNFTKLNKNVH